MWHKNLTQQNNGKREEISKLTRQIIREMYNKKCAYCGSKNKLHIHHINYDSSNNAISNLCLLCAECHSDLHPQNKRKILRWSWFEQHR